jgi:anti-anti-sigma factor
VKPLCAKCKVPLERHPKTGTLYCPSCRDALRPAAPAGGAPACHNCGRELEYEAVLGVLFCPSCDKALRPRAAADIPAEAPPLPTVEGPVESPARRSPDGTKASPALGARRPPRRRTTKVAGGRTRQKSSKPPGKKRKSSRRRTKKKTPARAEEEEISVQIIMPAMSGPEEPAPPTAEKPPAPEPPKPEPPEEEAEKAEAAGAGEGSLTVESREDGEIRVLTFQGEVGEREYEDFKREVRAALESQAKRIIVDLDAVAYMSSSGLSVLVWAHWELSKRDRRMITVNVHPRTLRLIEIISVDKVLEIAENVRAAVELPDKPADIDPT